MNWIMYPFSHSWDESGLHWSATWWEDHYRCSHSLSACRPYSFSSTLCIEYPSIPYWSGFSREIEPTDMWRDLWWVLVSRDYGGWGIPWFAICKASTKESRCVIPVQAQRPENQVAEGINPSSRKTNVLGQAGRQEGSKSFLPLCFICLGQEGLDDVHQYWRGPSTDSTDSTVNLIQKHPQGHTRNKVKSGHQVVYQIDT